MHSASLLGVDGVPVEVEVRISAQLPRVDVVGLPAAAVRESAARVRSAIHALGHKFPEQRVTVNLAPAELRKTGAGLDLPIAVAILAESGAVGVEALEGLALVGELSLDGRLRPVRGALALALAARDAGCRQLIVPESNGEEAAIAPRLDARIAPDLAAVLAHLLGAARLPRARCRPHSVEIDAGPDLREVRGQESGRRALEIAAAGGHALLLRGAPGAGKTMLARRLPGLLPPMRAEEALEVARIHGAAGSTRDVRTLERPFRAPHHTASVAGLIGGRNPPQPGEVSLAHRGVLFLDELLEFERRVLESLRQVLEARQVVLVRAGTRCTFPADLQLAAATNPCPCGWRGSDLRDCLCDDGAVARYVGRVSGPLLDRIDLHVRVRPLRWRELDGDPRGESSAAVRERVCRARRRQQRRQGIPNARLRDRDLDVVGAATVEARALLGRAVDRFALSARGARRTLKVARTVADLAGEARVGPAAMAEALAYRSEAEGSEAGDPGGNGNGSRRAGV